MADVTFIGALAAGLLSFLSPCVLPMVPFYLSYLTGISISQFSAEAVMSGRVRARAFFAAVCFAFGVITIFVGLGATASAFGGFVSAHFDTLRYLAAALIIAAGLHFLGLIRIGFLYRQLRAETGSNANTGLIGAYVMGLAFAFGWTPCVGPVLAAILFTAAGQDTAEQGAMLLFIYGLGMTLPFVLAALFVGPFMTWLGRFRRHLGLVERFMGVFLVLFGVLIATDTVNAIAQWILDHAPWFATIG